MIIKRKGFILRYPKISDLESFHKNINDNKINEMIPEVKYPCPLKIASAILHDAIKENEKKDRKKENFVIEINGQAVGAIGLTKIVKSHKAEIWSWLGKEYRNKGIMTNAHKFIVKYAIRKYKLKRIYGTLLVKNIASAKMLEKIGFHKEATLRKNTKINGIFFDEYLYAKIK